MSAERNFASARFEEHVRALQALVNARVEQKVTLMKPMTMVRELLMNGRSINKLDYSVKISLLKREVQRLTGLVESKYMKLQTMLGLVEEACPLRVDRSKEMGITIDKRLRIRFYSRWGRVFRVEDNK